MHISHLYRPDGTHQRMPPLTPQPLPRSRWGLVRQTAGLSREVRNLEDTPFYSRSQICIETSGGSLVGVHEQLDLQRFDARWVQFLLPFRMRRRA